MAVLQIEVQCPIFVAREWMRHRTQSFNEFSGRYAEMPALQYVPAPGRVQGQSGLNKQGSGDDLSNKVKESFLESIAMDQTTVRDHYEAYLEAGVARELARINLPLAQFTRFRAQANLRNWLHFLDLRLAENAQFEIRVYAQAVARLVQHLWPLTWETFEEHTLRGTRLSRSEVEILREILKEAIAKPGEPSLAETLKDRAGSRLSHSRQRELLSKLGLG
jgi:thymidylate synthase (FAD)